MYSFCAVWRQVSALVRIFLDREVSFLHYRPPCSRQPYCSHVNTSIMDLCTQHLHASNPLGVPGEPPLSAPGMCTVHLAQFWLTHSDMLATHCAWEPQCTGESPLTSHTHAAITIQLPSGCTRRTTHECPCDMCIVCTRTLLHDCC